MEMTVENLGPYLARLGIGYKQALIDLKHGGPL